MRAFPWLWCASACLAACEVEPTQLVVVVQTDMDVPAELDGFVVRARDERGDLAEPARVFALEGDHRVTLPASFGVAPRDGDADRAVTVEVDAMHGGDRLFGTRARTGFIEDEVLRLDLWLAERCIVEEDTCTAEQTCGHDGCMSPDVPPSSMPPWRGLDAGPPADAAPETDAGATTVTGTEVIRGDGAYATDLVVDDLHAAYVTGFFAGEVDVDGDAEGAAVPAVGAIDSFVTKVGEDGQRLWTVTFGFAGTEVAAHALAWSSLNTLLVFATANEHAELCGVASAEVLPVPVVLELEPEEGSCLGAEFGQATRGGSQGEGRALRALGDGTRFLSGWLRAGLDVGGTTLYGAALVDTAFLVEDSTRVPACGVVVGGEATSQGSVLSWDLQGGVLWGGRFGPAGMGADFGIGEVNAQGAFDGFVADVAPGCGLAWVRTVGGELDVAGVEALNDGSNQVLLVATSRGPAMLEDVVLEELGGTDVLAVRLSPAPDPGTESMTRLGGVGDELVLDGAAYDGTGMLVAGSFAGTTNLHGADVVARGPTDGFVLALDRDLTVRWIMPEAGNGADSVTAVAWDEAAGTVLAAGDSTEGLWLGDDRLDPAPLGRLVFLHRFTPVEN